MNQFHYVVVFIGGEELFCKGLSTIAEFFVGANYQ